MHLHFDPVGGVAGDMILGALLDLGAPRQALLDLPKRLGLTGVAVHLDHCLRHQISALRVDVQVTETTKSRHLSDIRKLILSADLPAAVSNRALSVFERLAAAEAAIHNSDLEAVHFHEVGANDALVDIVGSSLLMHELGVSGVTCGPLPLGRGVTQAAHGKIPLPAPATLSLLEEWPVQWVEEEGERVTPTGAAFVTATATPGRPPAGRLCKTGYGAGSRDGVERPNLLRLLLIEPEAQTPAACLESVDELVAVTDDATGEELAFASEILLGAGALDAYHSPLVMKKGRPGWQFTVLCRPAQAGELMGLILCHTTTAGVRRRQLSRLTLQRRHVTVETPHGKVRVKEFIDPNGGRRAAPEFEDCRSLALDSGLSLARVREAALQAYEQLEGKR